LKFSFKINLCFDSHPKTAKLLAEPKAINWNYKESRNNNKDIKTARFRRFITGFRVVYLVLQTRWES